MATSENTVVTAAVSPQILNVQYWFAQNVQQIENMLGKKVKNLQLNYDDVHGISISYVVKVDTQPANSNDPVVATQ